MKVIRTEQLEAYVYQRAKMGNEQSGDTYFVHSEKGYSLFAIADGLGSGPIARQSAQVIPSVLQEHHEESLEELLSRCNEYMVQKRGAAVAIVKFDYKKRTVQYSCVGNVRFYMLQNGEQMIYPLPVMGYLSGKPQTLKTQEYPYKAGDLFILHSDGVSMRSPKALLKESSNPYELSRTIEHTINHEDDATFIVGNLLP